MTDRPVNAGDRVDPPPHDELDALLWAWHDQNVRQAEAGRPRMVRKLFEEAAAAPEPVALIGPHGVERRRRAAAVVMTFARNRYTRLAAAIAILATLVTLLVPTGGRQAWAGEALVARAGRLDALDPAGALIGPCPLDFTDVEAAVTGPLSRVTVTQTYRNPYARPIEAVYTFPLSDRAAVDAFAMTIGDRVVTGEVHESSEAERMFDSARDSGRPAALLETGASRVYAQRVTNIPPAAKVEIRFTYVETLEYRDGAYRFSFPLEVAPRYLPPGSQFEHGTPLPPGLAHRHGLNLLGPASLRVGDIGDGKTAALPPAVIQTVIDAGHPVQTPEAEAPVTQSFEVTYDDGATEAGALRADGTGHVGSRWFWVDPGLVGGIADAGRGGKPVARTPAPPPEPVLPKRRPGDDVAVTVTIDAAGAGLLGVNSSSHDVLVRDGEIATVMLADGDTIPNRAFDLAWHVRDHAPNVLVHTGEYGAYSGNFFALQVPSPPAHATGDDSDVDLGFAFSVGLEIVDAYAASTPHEAGDPLLIVGRYRAPGGGTFGIHGTDGDFVLGEEIAITLPEPTGDNAMIASLWAQAKLGELDPADTEQILDLCRAFGIVGDLTSYVTVEKAQVTIDGESLLVRVPTLATGAVDEVARGYVVSDRPRFAGGRYARLDLDAPREDLARDEVELKELEGGKTAHGLSRAGEASEQDVGIRRMSVDVELTVDEKRRQNEAAHKGDADRNVKGARGSGGGGAFADDRSENELATVADRAAEVTAVARKLTDELVAGAAAGFEGPEPAKPERRLEAPASAPAPAPSQETFHFGQSPTSHPEMIADVMTKLVEPGAWERNGGTELRAVVTDGRVDVEPLTTAPSTQTIFDGAVDFLDRYAGSFDDDGRETGAAPAGFRDSPADVELTEKMHSTYLRSLFFNGVALKDALEDIEEQARVEIDADWAALSKLGVEPTDPVDLRPNRLGIAMSSVIEQIGDEKARPVVDARLGRMVLTSDEARRRHTSIVAYDVRDLVDAYAALLAAGGEAPPDLSASWAAYRLGDVLQLVIDPPWRATGGDSIAFVAHDGRLFVRTMLANHRLIQRVLTQLRLALDLPTHGADRAAAEAVQQLVVSPENEEVRALLGRAAPPDDLTGGTVEDVLVELSQASESVISVDWDSLAALGATREDRVRLEGSADNVAEALEEVLGQVGSAGFPPRYTVERGRVVVGSDEALSRRTEILAYDAREVLRRSLPARWGGDTASRLGDLGVVQTELAESILAEVEPKTWRVNGGEIGEVVMFGGGLVVDNTLEIHLAVKDHLAELRERGREQDTPSLGGLVLPAQATGDSRLAEVLDQRLWDDMRGDHARPRLGAPRADPVRVAILVTAVEPSVRAQITRGGGEIKAMVPSSRLIIADVLPHRLPALVAVPGVLRIEPLDAEKLPAVR